MELSHIDREERRCRKQDVPQDDGLGSEFFDENRQRELLSMYVRSMLAAATARREGTTRRCDIPLSAAAKAEQSQLAHGALSSHSRGLGWYLL
ncbi:hypothetical protein D9613_002488 [Agrocybe pediades]|uniref:Uncharacterized protein n=1 Tax=Agrocybe pediades TaxID=84607 RepID=A0A8H4VP48_9AGAR|nr:hypothetical protein D9613_002488 [Agrocybe pediades]